MKWNKIRLKTTSLAEDIVSAILMDAGIEGVQIEDKIPLTEEDKKGMFVDIMPETIEDDGIAYLNFYIESGESGNTILSNAMKELDEMREFTDLGDLTLEISETEDVDWINNWKEFFHQFTIGDLLITPSWEEPEDTEANMILRIDPGTAFGTGKHETTELCIRNLQRFVKGSEEILDIGTGSGILALVSLKLGAKHVLGTDLDEMAFHATHDNMDRNDVDESLYEVTIGNIIDDANLQDYAGYKKCDIITANILAEALIELTPVVKKCIKPGGLYITSGILTEKADMMQRVIKSNGFDIVRIDEMGEWVSIVAKEVEKEGSVK
ncbi:MAG: 50S ribosomal protein L11 methyltransferase [Suipraeoptans sp.]